MTENMQELHLEKYMRQKPSAHTVKKREAE